MQKKESYKEENTNDECNKKITGTKKTIVCKD